MQSYQVSVNGNTYTVRVKSFNGNLAVVDVDGWEYQVAVTDSGCVPVSATVNSEAIHQQSIQSPVQPVQHKKRTSSIDKVTIKKPEAHQAVGAGTIIAHLPGQIVGIMVKVGDTVKAGDVVCKMEAMKMVNEVKAKKDGVVKEIYVKEQQTVLENQALMLIE
jgi:glutaconyl-CoA/methylmalonyl-CoA decarboxylase subunit gamma